MAFLEVHVLVKESFHGFFGTQQVHKELFVNTPIVVVIIGEVLWYPEDIGSQMHANLMP